MRTRTDRNVQDDRWKSAQKLAQLDRRWLLPGERGRDPGIMSWDAPPRIGSLEGGRAIVRHAAPQGALVSVATGQA